MSGGAFHMKFNNDVGDGDPSTSSSSIGNNSEDEERDASDEVQSNFSRAPFDSLQALEHVLPIRRGISSFYSGKSKSFACLSTSVSAKDIAKPDNAYNRKRRNLIASAVHVWDRLHRTNSPVIHKSSLMRASRSTLALGLAMSRSNSSSSSSSSSGNSEDSNCSRSGSHLHLPPVHPN